jgi:putative inorganic carbon (HCO3(-)) transporter
MIAVAAAVLLSTLTSPDRLQSFSNARKLLLLPLVSLAAMAWARPQGARTAYRWFVAALATSAVVASAYFLLTAHPPDARLRANGHYMTFAGLLLLATPLAGAAACGTRGRTRVWYAAATLVLGGALLLTFTRGAWIGASLAALVMLARVRRRWMLLVPVVVVAIVLVLPSAYRARALSSFDPSHPHNVDRVRLWRAGVAMWRDRPWTGFGWIDLKPQVLRYRDTTEGVAHGHLHANWIHLLASFGIVGLAAFVWLSWGHGRIAWRAAAAALDAETQALGHGVWGAFIAFHVMGLFEWNLGDAEVTMTLWVLLGAAAAAATASKTRNDPTAGKGGT